MAKVLLDGGANVNTHDKQGRSVLMVRKFLLYIIQYVSKENHNEFFCDKSSPWHVLLH